MATTTARTRTDVDSMEKKDRLWDSLNYSYGKKRESSDKAYDQAYSQADRQALSRGMQRSSYNAQNLANIDQRKIEAQNDIWDTQIADYENRLGQLEQQEAEADRWEREFAANREDAAWNKEFQQKQADVSQNNWQLQFDAGRADADWQKQFQERQYGDTRADAERNWNFTQQQYADTRADADWQKQFQTQQYADSRADADWQKSFQQQQYADSRTDADWQKQFQTQQYADSRSDAERNWNFTQQQYADTRADAQRNWEFTQQQYADTRADTAWNQAFQTQQYADSRADTAWNQAFQQSQADLQRDQWERQFGYSQKTTEQQVAMQYAMSILQNGQMPSADLLASAGLSEADARAMMKQASGSGGTTNPGTKNDTGDDEDDSKKPKDRDVESAFAENGKLPFVFKPEKVTTTPTQIATTMNGPSVLSRYRADGIKVEKELK